MPLPNLPLRVRTRRHQHRNDTTTIPVITTITITSITVEVTVIAGVIVSAEGTVITTTRATVNTRHLVDIIGKTTMELLEEVEIGKNGNQGRMGGTGHEHEHELDEDEDVSSANARMRNGSSKSNLMEMQVYLLKIHY